MNFPAIVNHSAPPRAAEKLAPDYAGFGRFLKASRDRKGLSIDALAKNTKIPPTLIAALEEGAAERLPERVFLVNYVRSYALAVGESPDQFVARFHEVPGAPRAEIFDPAALEVARRERALTAMWVTFAAIALSASIFAVTAMIDIVSQYANR